MSRPRRALKILLVTLGLMGSCSVAAYFKFRPPPPDPNVVSIKTLDSYQDAELLARAWALPGASAYAESVSFQSNGSTCGPTSVANLGRSLGDDEDSEAEVLASADICWTGYCIPGITLDELAGLEAQMLGAAYEVEILRELSLEDFRDELRALNQGERRYLANFSRRPLFGQGGGHHSPLAAYLDREDLVLVLDVNETFKPWLVPAPRLHEAMAGTDSQSGKSRGLLRVSPVGGQVGE